MFREHPELGAAMGGTIPDADEPMRLAIGLYCDGVETVNPIGVARGRCASTFRPPWLSRTRAAPPSRFARARSRFASHPPHECFGMLLCGPV
eukprot:6204661-Pleurochrysis_carterae.AAC.1